MTMMIIAAVLQRTVIANGHNTSKMSEVNQQGRPVNPCVKPRPPPPPHNEVIMGRQSQQRIGNQNKRKHKLASNTSNNKKRKGHQTLFGGVAFEAEKDCIVCKAQALKRILDTYRVPNRAHHVLCLKNTKTTAEAKGS